MSNIYEITGEMLELYNMMDDPELDDKIILDSLESVMADFEQKADSYGKVIKNIEADIMGLDKEIKRLQSRKKTAENNIKRIKETLLHCMDIAQIPEIQGDLFKFKPRNNGQFLPDDIEEHRDLIPEDYLIPQDPKIDKRALLKAVKEKKVEGITLIDSRSLTLK